MVKVARIHRGVKMDLVTKRTKLKEFDEKKSKELAKRFHIKADEMEYISKGFVELDGMEIQDGERAVIKYVSTISVDRDGDIVLPKGVILDDFQKNPVVLYGHNYGGLPIGRDLWIKPTEKGLLAKQTYYNHQLADDVYNIHKDGGGLASSIGFIPIKAVHKSDKKAWDDVVGQVKKEYGVEDKAFDGANTIFTKTYLLEHSDVPVPSNPDALTLAVKSGFTFHSKDVEHDIFPKEVGDQGETIKALEERIDDLEKRAKFNLFCIEKMNERPEEDKPKGITPERAGELIGKALEKITNKIDIKRGLV